MTPRPSSLRTAALAPSLGAGTLMLGVLAAFPAIAEPLSYVASLGEDDIPGGIQSLRYAEALGDTRVVVVSSGGQAASAELLVLTRDPDSGALALFERIPGTGERGQPDLRRIGIGRGTAVGNTLYVPGIAAEPGCSVPCAGKPAIYAYTLNSDGTLTRAFDTDLRGGSGVGLADIIAFPDGEYLVALSKQNLNTLRVDGVAGGLAPLDNAVSLGTQGLGIENLAAQARDFVITPDGRHAIITLPDLGSESVLATFALDSGTGALTLSSFIRGEASAPLGKESHLALSPDGRTLYATVQDSDVPENGGIARLAVADDGSLEYLGLDASGNARVADSSERLGNITLSGDGRQLYALDARGVLTKYTVDEDGSLTWRGTEANGEDGVPARALNTVSAGTSRSYSLWTSDDDRYVYHQNTNGLSWFDASADLGYTLAGGAPVGNDGTLVGATVQLFNAGPAIAHGLVVEIVSGTPIATTSMPEACTIDGVRATCRIDRLVDRTSLDIGVTSALGADGTNTLSVTGTQIETDPDASDNTASAVLTGTALPAPDTGAPVGSGAPAGDSDDGGGGCSITGTSRANDALFVLLGMFAAVGLRRRRRAVA